MSLENATGHHGPPADRPPIPHEFKWNKELIARYWDVFGNIRPVSPWFSVKAYSWLIVKILKCMRSSRTPASEFRILDMGSGSGEFISRVASDTGADCYGIDLSPERIRNCSEQFGNVKFSVGEFSKCGHPDNYFDLVISTQTIEHLLEDDLEKAIAEISRVLRPGGILVVTTRFEEDLDVGKKVCPECLAIFLHSQHLQSFSEERLTALLRTYRLLTVESGRSRCRKHLHEFIPKRFRFLNWIGYRIFGRYLDRRIGKYLYALARKMPVV